MFYLALAFVEVLYSVGKVANCAAYQVFFVGISRPMHRRLDPARERAIEGVSHLAGKYRPRYLPVPGVREF